MNTCQLSLRRRRVYPGYHLYWRMPQHCYLAVGEASGIKPATSNQGRIHAHTHNASNRSITDILDRHPNLGPDHLQPDSGTDRKARTCGRDQGCCAASAHPGDSSCRSGRAAGWMGAGQLRARTSRRPPLRQRFPWLSVPH